MDGSRQARMERRQKGRKETKNGMKEERKKEKLGHITALQGVCKALAHFTTSITGIYWRTMAWHCMKSRRLDPAWTYLIWAGPVHSENLQNSM